MARTRFTGVLIMGALFVAGVIWWRGCQSESGSSLQGDRTASESTPHERGGQVVASLRAEPRSFNRLITGDQTTETLWMLMQGRLLRINRSTFELEPWLAEKWESSAD